MGCFIYIYLGQFKPSIFGQKNFQRVFDPIKVDLKIEYSPIAEKLKEAFWTFGP
jgi:hypothetical protein